MLCWFLGWWTLTWRTMWHGVIFWTCLLTIWIPPQKKRSPQRNLHYVMTISSSRVYIQREKPSLKSLGSIQVSSGQTFKYWYITAGEKRAYWLLCSSDLGNMKPRVRILILWPKCEAVKSILSQGVPYCPSHENRKSQYARFSPAVKSLLCGGFKLE